jgi:peptidyl-prolyl cis-trans isomerase C
VITVNGIPISEEQVAREAQYHPAASRDDALREAAVALVIRELLLQEAAALGIHGQEEVRAAEVRAAEAAPEAAGEVTAEVRAAADDSTAPEEGTIAALLEHEVRLPAADEQAFRRYYEANRERFRSPDLFEASQILFAARADRPQERERAAAAAAATLEELRRDPAAFERLARERSADPESREQGGHMGQVTRGQTTPEFEACLDSLAPGELCRQPVQTRYGFHLVRLDRALRGRQLPFELARERIQEYLGISAWTRAVHQYIQLLVGKATIEGIELAGAVTPLVQ